MKLLKGTFFLKISALVMAIASYFYIHHQIELTERKNATDLSYRLIKLTAKNLPVKPLLATRPPDGYRLVEEGIKVSPTQVLVVGPEALLEGEMIAQTSMIDLAESTKTVTKKVPIESVSGIHLTGEPPMIEVTVPIVAVSAEKDPSGK